VTRLCAASLPGDDVVRSPRIPRGKAESSKFNITTKEIRMQQHQTHWLRAAAGLLIAAVVAPAFAQEEAVKTSSAGSSVKVVKLSTVLKSDVLIQEDQSAGRVVDIVMNDGGCVEYYIASYNDEYYAIPYSAIVWRNNAVFVNITPAQFKSVQFFSSNNWPNFGAAAYRTKVFSTFGVNAARAETQSTFKPEAKSTEAKDANRDAKASKDQPTPRDSKVEKPALKDQATPRDRPQPGVVDPQKPAPDKTPAEKPKAEEKKPIEKPKLEETKPIEKPKADEKKPVEKPKPIEKDNKNPK